MVMFWALAGIPDTLKLISVRRSVLAAPLQAFGQTDVHLVPRQTVSGVAWLMNRSLDAWTVVLTGAAAAAGDKPGGFTHAMVTMMAGSGHRGIDKWTARMFRRGTV
ncbi:hypothetical protein FE391_26275 [Nonomuraea sp. KC401]|uniref:hypothetical protein n=1 Tax=unclassified Nonomuraea TaxID=2593643 RepID=UPI0010FD9739|nr:MULTISPECIES: hypothetical protein [unclassified Nonomuraea]NBE97276.1 hypothetical protein [Nonomuraea sp. K271]TLF65873.1 hypothetical protein FE391_26275 [Nonomuraea sp. KC401]